MKTNYLDHLLEELVKSEIPGCSLHVMQRGELRYEGYFGCADVQAKTPVTEASVFRMASMSKVPLFTALMILVEQGSILFTDPMSRFFPEWKAMRKAVKKPDGTTDVVPTDGPITVKDVMMMSCGLPYCLQNVESDDVTVQSMVKCMQPLWERGHFTLREEIRALSGAVLAFEPGTRWMYGFSSELAAGILEAVCGKPANDVLAELLFKPLKMNETRPHYFGTIKERMVTLYSKREDGTYVPAQCALDDKHNPGERFETGNPRLFSTGRDFSRLMQMLANGGELDGVRVMGRKTIDLMRTNTLNAAQLKDFQDDYNAGYGYGYGVRTLLDKAAGNNNGALGSFGWTGGFGTWCEADPEDGVSIVFMFNQFPWTDGSLHARIRTAAYGIVK